MAASVPEAQKHSNIRAEKATQRDAICFRGVTNTAKLGEPSDWEEMWASKDAELKSVWRKSAMEPGSRARWRWGGVRITSADQLARRNANVPGRPEGQGRALARPFHRGHFHGGSAEQEQNRTPLLWERKLVTLFQTGTAHAPWSFWRGSWNKHGECSYSGTVVKPKPVGFLWNPSQAVITPLMTQGPHNPGEASLVLFIAVKTSLYSGKCERRHFKHSSLCPRDCMFCFWSKLSEIDKLGKKFK